MTAWTADELRHIDDALELQIRGQRGYVTIWAVRVDDAVYVRSAHGAENPWFARAAANAAGRVRTDGVDRDVTFTRVEGDSPIHEAIDQAYHSKYDRYGPQIVGSVVGPEVRDVTLLVQP